MKRIVLITGGQRSGKSSYAEALALQSAPDPVHVATARIFDDEFRERVRRHQERRGPEWTNIEEPVHLGRFDFTGRTVLVDCVTLWCTNFFFDLGESVTEPMTYECWQRLGMPFSIRPCPKIPRADNLSTGYSIFWNSPDRNKRTCVSVSVPRLQSVTPQRINRARWPRGSIS